MVMGSNLEKSKISTTGDYDRNLIRTPGYKSMPGLLSGQPEKEIRTLKSFVFVLLVLALALWHLLRAEVNSADLSAPAVCPQVDSIYPRKHAKLSTQIEALIHWDGYKQGVYNRLGGAIQIPTESYDDLKPVGQDARWGTFGWLHQYLESTFPLVYQSLRVTRVNTYALVFHWQGTNETLLPILLTAHQDVVPVEPSTVDQWEHPPYSGHYDGKWIWGRGSVDDKADLITQLITVDTLLKHGFVPARTVVLAYGIDEEASGEEGAGKLGGYLEETYGKDGFAMLIDEGGGVKDLAGGEVIMAAPDVSEKGYLDVGIRINTVGGHSSIPPAHTSIGMLASMIVEIESHAHTPQLLRSGTPFALAQCLAAYDPATPPGLRRLAARAVEDDRALEAFKDGLIKWHAIWDATLKTTQAADLVNGGVKVNALPETVEAVVNHRIAEHSSVRELQDYFTTLLSPLAASYNLSVNAFGRATSNCDDVCAGELILSDAFDNRLEVSPVTPFFGSAPARLLSGTIKATIESSEGYNASSVVVAPSFGLGNTDTKSYWNLTRHIFRYTHRNEEKEAYNGAHTVNEAVLAASVVEEVRFFINFILNADESDLI
ncbi:Zn-dependent exopeptidase [Neolentinus lepideus HHB14362 ss-1]|uniref:Zn-dependent exopeptidase n=1 Tax=Neolentinus lepideus HHB14362 ss-1 TaxID=1314782 RepID=A0A165UAH6_9AGAM|nr:Zn-dependent exopeptidase [Neolentinus lepideus HHB14362 ss-1]